VSDIDTAVVDSLKVLDPKRPIREADIGQREPHGVTLVLKWFLLQPLIVNSDNEPYRNQSIRPENSIKPVTRGQKSPVH
jgi:hypothetical protein